jgi:peptidoglycan/LPS O-acetylase OafA/YrhL
VALTAGGDLGGAPAIMRLPAARALGDASYSIYMLHPVFGTLFFSVLWKRGLARLELPVPLYCVIIAGLVCAVSILSHTYFERPAREFFSGRKTSNGRSEVVSRPDREAAGAMID